MVMNPQTVQIFNNVSTICATRSFWRSVWSIKLVYGCIVSKPIRKHYKTYWLRETDLCNLLMRVIESTVRISTTFLLFAWLTYHSLHVCTTDSRHEWRNTFFNIILYLHSLSYLYGWNYNMNKCKSFILAVLIQFLFMLYGDGADWVF